MASPAQAFANLANAQLSTGPRTEAGKARVSQNARKHGFTASRPVVLPEEEDEFGELAQSLRYELRPEGTVQEVLFGRILHGSWNMQRIDRVESDLVMESLTVPRDETPSAKTKPIATDPLLNKEIAPGLDRLHRYHTAAERSFYRALHELRAQQTLRAERLAAPAELADTLPPLATIGKITKQSQVVAQKAKEADMWRYLAATPSRSNGGRLGNFRLEEDADDPDGDLDGEFDEDLEEVAIAAR